MAKVLKYRNASARGIDLPVITLICILLCSSVFSSYAIQGNVVINPAPAGAELSTDFKVFAGNKSVDVYRIQAASMDDTWRSHNYSMAAFDFSGDVTIKIYPSRFSKILPESSGVRCEYHNDTLILKLYKPCQLSIEPPAASSIGPLVLFANPLEVNPPDRSEKNVLFFGPGIYRKDIKVKSNQTLYIAGGAIIQGTIEASGENIVIMGRGIVDGIPFGGGGINISGKNIKVEGIIFKSPSGWSVVAHQTDSLSILNVKVCGNRGIRSDDAIDLVNCRKVLIRDCFLRAWDDPIAIKGMDAPLIPDSAIVIEKCVLWSDGANVFRIGCECTAKAMEDIIIRDIDVIHAHSRRSQEYPLWFITLQPAENMQIRNILFENIRVNWEGQKYLIEIVPQVTKWSKPPEGSIQNVILRDITVSGTFDVNGGLISIAGAGNDHPVKNIVFENVSVNGHCITKVSRQLTIGNNVTDLQFKSGTTQP
jgi:hypothetical protein